MNKTTQYIEDPKTSSINFDNLPNDSKSRFRDICADLSNKLHDFFDA